MTPEEKKALIAQKLHKRNAYENKHKGNFDLIFPSENFKAEDHQKFLDSAHDCYEEFNNRGQAKQKRQEAAEKEEKEKALQLAKEKKQAANGVPRPPSGKARVTSATGSIINSTRKTVISSGYGQDHVPQNDIGDNAVDHLETDEQYSEYSDMKQNQSSLQRQTPQRTNMTYSS